MRNFLKTFNVNIGMSLIFSQNVTYLFFFWKLNMSGFLVIAKKKLERGFITKDEGVLILALENEFLKIIYI